MVYALLAASVFLILFGLPIAYVIGIASTAWVILEDMIITIIPSRLQSGINSFVLLAIPFFIMAGDLMSRVGITDKLIDWINVLLGRVRGGLAHVVIFFVMIFSAITGSGVAVVAAVGGVFGEAMEKQGYNKAWAMANIANAAIVGPIIPPSILMVIYGGATGVSIGAMLIGGIIPGLILGLGQSTLVALSAKRRNLPKVDLPYKVTPTIVFTKTMKALPALFMPMIIVGGIMSGVFTPTEAAAVSALYAAILGVFFYRSLSIRDFVLVARSTIRQTAMLLFILGVSGILAWMFARMGVASMVVETLRSISDNPRIIFGIVIVVLMFMGTWLDASAIIVLVAPIIAPLMQSLGVHPVHFAVVMVSVVCMGMVTPPLGVCLFAASSMSKVPIEKIVKEIVPFLIYDIAVMVVLMFFPQLVLWLPRTFGLTY